MLRPILAAAALLSMLATAPAMARAAGLPSLLSLTGHGEVKVAPDMATVSVGVVSQGANAAAALADNTKAMTAVMAALKSAGIADKDIQTAGFSVQPRYEYGNNGQAPKLVGYDTTSSFDIAVRQLDRTGALLDVLVRAGSNQVSGIAFQVSEPDAALDEARRRAVADAKRKASVYAKAMGVGLGAVSQISEGAVYRPPGPMRMRVVGAEPEMADAPAPIAAGEQTLSVDVNVTWEIR